MYYYKGSNLKPIKKYEKYHFNQKKNINELESMGYKAYRAISSIDDHVYTYVFPVYRYKATITLEARFLVHVETGDISVDVFDSNTKGIYAPWYNNESGIYDSFIDIIDANITKEMKRQKIMIA